MVLMWHAADENDGADGNEAASGSEREEEEDDDDLLSRRRGGPAGGPGQAGQPKSEGDEGMDVAVSHYANFLRLDSDLVPMGKPEPSAGLPSHPRLAHMPLGYGALVVNARPKGLLPATSVLEQSWETRCIFSSRKVRAVLDMQVDKDGKGEDWEHEEERADDDVDMGEDGDDAEASPTPPK